MLSDLRSHLLSQSAVTAAVGQRVYVSAVPQGESFPAVVLHTVSETHDYALGEPTGVVRTRVQIDSLGHTYKQAVEAHDAVRDALLFLRGAVGSAEVLVALLDNRTDLYEAPGDGSDKPVHRIVSDYRILTRRP